MARTFNGSSDYIELTSAPTTDVPLTLACWFQKVSMTTTTALMSLGDANAVSRAQMDARGATGGDPVGAASVNSTGTSAVATTGTMSANTWAHAAAVFTTADSRLAYFNGAAGSVESTSISLSGIDDLQLGARYSTTRGAFLDGILAEVGIWSAALNAAEVASLAAGFCPRLIRPQSLVFYAPLIRDVKNIKGGTLTASGTSVSAHPRIFY